ncbi:hypothetical protein H9P43_004754 [Blastocladiella emersonii ATCC 22665]|nr:hypothetical protein H9P43_004754 [Blastocladiella emersonii ATCC 22665]
MSTPAGPPPASPPPIQDASGDIPLSSPHAHEAEDSVAPLKPTSPPSPNLASRIKASARASFSRSSFSSDPTVRLQRPSVTEIMARLRRRSSRASTASSSASTLKRPAVLVPFGIIFTAFMVGMSLLVAPLSWYANVYFTHTAGISTSQQFADQLQSALLDHAVTSIVIHVDTAERLSGLQQANWAKGNFQLNDKAAAMKQLFPRLKANQDLVVTQSFTTAQGELWGYYTSLTNPKNATSRVYTRWETNGNNYTEYRIDVNDRVLAVTGSDLAYNGSTGDWVTIVDPAKPAQVSWTPVYVWSSVSWLTCSRPMYDAQGRYIGVVSTDMELTFMNQLLNERTVAVTRPTLMYAFEAKTEYIIGTSSASLDIFKRDTLGVPQMPFTLSELAGIKSDLILSALKKYLTDAGTPLAKVTNTTLRVRALNDTNLVWMVNTQTIQRNTVNWVIVQVMNEEEVMHDINQSGYSAAGAVLGLLVACVLLGVMFALGFSRSLARVTRELHHITETDFGSIDLSKATVEQPSMIRENLAIQQSFFNMVRAFSKASADNRSLRGSTTGGTTTQSVSMWRNNGTATTTASTLPRGDPALSANQSGASIPRGVAKSGATKRGT